MEEIDIFDFSGVNKGEMIALYKARKNSTDAAIKYTEVRLECLKKALEEYKKHPASELVIPSFTDFDTDFADTVGVTISAIETDIKSAEAYLAGAYNRVRDALEWCDRALDKINESNLDDGFKLGYAIAAITVIKSKLTRELAEQQRDL